MSFEERLDGLQARLWVASAHLARALASEIAKAVRKQAKPRQPSPNDQVDAFAQPSQIVKIQRDSHGATVIVQPHYEWAGPSLKELGADELSLSRDGLWVTQSGSRTLGSETASWSSSHFVSFAGGGGHDRLFAWAQREDRGKQVNRRAVFVGDEQGTAKLLLWPGVKRANKTFPGLVRAMERSLESAGPAP